MTHKYTCSGTTAHYCCLEILNAFAVDKESPHDKSIQDNAYQDSSIWRWYILQCKYINELADGGWSNCYVAA